MILEVAFKSDHTIFSGTPEYPWQGLQEVKYLRPRVYLTDRIDYTKSCIELALNVYQMFYNLQNELACLELIQNFVETMQKYFNKVVSVHQ